MKRNYIQKVQKAVTFLLLFMMVSHPAAVYARNIDSNDDSVIMERFEITGGLNKKSESTFDTSRTITGTTNEGVQVIIQSYLYEDGEMMELYFYEIDVGASGLFTQSIDLSVGENHIEISAVNQDRDTFASESYVIKRKDEEIKRELEQSSSRIGR